MKYIILLTIFVSNIALGVTPIKKGEVSPHDGYIFTVEEEKALRTRDMQRIKLEELNTLKDQKIELQNEKIKILESHISTSSYTKYGYFALGVLTTIGSLYVSSLILRNLK
jgi:hypothetical protein